MEAEIRNAADAGGFGQNVNLAGRKIAPEVASYMQAADVLCLSSDNEGVPNVIMEAFASGLKIVSTDVGGIGEVLNREFLGKLVPAGDQTAFTNALAEVLSQPAQTEKIRECALGFSWEKAADAYLNLLNKAVER